MNLKMKAYDFLNSNKFKTIFFSCLIFGLCAHGMAFFNLYSHHDNMNNMFDEPGIFLVGRWALTILRSFNKIINGYMVPLLPMIDGFVSIFFIMIIVYLYVNYMEIRNRLSMVLLGGMFVTFPVVTSEFGYMFTAPYHFLGTLLGVIGCYLIEKCKNKKVAFVFSVLLICVSLGVYQVNFCFCASMLLIGVIRRTYKSYDLKLQDFLSEVVFKLMALVCAGVSYIVCNQFYLWYRESSMISYGDSFMREGGIKSYLSGVITAYKLFFCPSIDSSNMYPYHAKYVYILILLALAIIFVTGIYNTNGIRRICLLILFLIIPLASHFCYVIFVPESVHSLMVYSFLTVFVFFIWFMEEFEHKVLFFRVIKGISYAGIIYLIIFYINFANVCYLKTELIQQETIAYCTTLITRIQMTEGYTIDTPVVYINDRQKIEEIVSETEWPIEIYLTPYEDDSYINDYVWYKFMRRWCGFNPVQGERSRYEGNKEVEEMPSYPEYNSIKIIDDQLVVKF